MPGNAPGNDAAQHDSASPARVATEAAKQQFAPGQHAPGSRGLDPLGSLHRGVGNRAAGNLLRLADSRTAGPGTIARQAEASNRIQRATFAELMAFWRTQELKEPPEKAQAVAAKEAKSVAPEPANDKAAEESKDQPGVSEETKDTGGTPDPDKVEGEVKVVSSVASKTLSGSGSDGKSDSADFKAKSVESSLVSKTAPSKSGAGSGTPFNSVPSLKGGGSGSGGTVSMTASSASTVPAPNLYGNKTKVKYIDPGAAQKEFELGVSGGITQGGQAYDTSHMYSKFKGDGFGIYVMGTDGKFYSNSHKIGLFHHSSFLSGSSVTGAGEMKVTGGNLEWITNKSGHYFPGEAQLVQTLTQLQGASGFATAKIGVFDDNYKWKDDLPGGAAQFLKDQAWKTGGGAGNKDTFKYDTKPMGSGHAGEENDSVALVRSLIVSYVDMAQRGKLKKFNKPNPAFGSDIADIKALVLAEFGWEQSDVDNYKEVLENWNNDKKIGEPPDPVSMGGFSATSASLTSATPNSKLGSKAGSASSGSGPAGGRDWEGELAELLKANPSPDFAGLGFNLYSGRWELKSKDGNSSVQAEAWHKVLLLKGEKTFDELRPENVSF